MLKLFDNPDQVIGWGPVYLEGFWQTIQEVTAAEVLCTWVGGQGFLVADLVCLGLAYLCPSSSDCFSCSESPVGGTSLMVQW